MTASCEMPSLLLARSLMLICSDITIFFFNSQSEFGHDTPGCGCYFLTCLHKVFNLPGVRTKCSKFSTINQPLGLTFLKRLLSEQVKTRLTRALYMCKDTFHGLVNISLV